MRLLWGKKQKEVETEAAAAVKLRMEKEELQKRLIEIESKPVIITPGPSSVRDEPISSIDIIQATLKILPAEYEFEVVPIIRKLTKINPDIGQAFNDTVRLANTGHKVYFDPSVDAEQIDEMRDALFDSARHWHVGAAGINGVINKMFRQALIGGAIANEWIPNLKLDDLEELRFLYPERIRFVIEKNSKGYQAYQQIKNINSLNNIGQSIAWKLRKLNKEQFKYYALNGDTDLPYGVPPYLPALDPIATQRNMIDNIKFIVECLGVLGYLDARIAKPDQKLGESDDTYRSRMVAFLNTFKERVKLGLRDGVNVGFMDEHEYEFKQTARTAQGVKELFEQNELLVSSGLNYDAAFMGRPGGSESLITILFTKMIAQLTNLQDIVRENLEYGYKLVLTLKGYKFKKLRVQFNRSTITDDLKYQQAEEIKLRNLVLKFQYGVISLEQFADELQYLKPDQKEPRIEIDPVAAKAAAAGGPPAKGPSGKAAKKQKREGKKNTSDRKVRDKNKPQGTTRKGGGKKAGVNHSSNGVHAN